MCKIEHKELNLDMVELQSVEETRMTICAVSGGLHKYLK